MSIPSIPLLSPISKKQNDPPNTNIKLKDHQKAMLYRCQEIESKSSIVIMSDGPGSGKSYVALATMLWSKERTGRTRNLLVVPQNIHQQWLEYITNYSDNLLCKSFIEYNDIQDLYYDASALDYYDIILTTTLYYNLIVSTAQTNNHKFDRIVVDEIDSADWFITDVFPADKCWLISASFNAEKIGAYKLKPAEMPQISCQCNETFISASFLIPEPIEFRHICYEPYANVFGFLAEKIPENNIVVKTETQTSAPTLTFKKLQYQINGLQYFPLDLQHITAPLDHVSSITSSQNVLSLLIKDKLLVIANSEEIILKNFAKLVPDTRVIDREVNLNKEGSTLNFLNSLKIPEVKMIHKLAIIENINNLIKIKKEVSEMIKQVSNSKEKVSNKCPICISNENLEILGCCSNKFCKECLKFSGYKCLNPLCRKKLDKESIKSLLKESNKVSSNETNESSNESHEVKKMKVKSNLRDSVKQMAIESEKERLASLEKLEKLKASKLKQELIDREILAKQLLLDLKKPIDDRLLTIPDNLTKLETLDRILFILSSNSSLKLIIFSDFRYIFNKVIDIIKGHKLTYEQLEGGSLEELHKTIDNYKTGNTSILLIEAGLYASGLNLENTTDIILLHNTVNSLQIIGRANRPNRNGPLRIQLLLYENEN